MDAQKECNGVGQINFLELVQKRDEFLKFESGRKRRVASETMVKKNELNERENCFIIRIFRVSDSRTKRSVQHSRPNQNFSRKMTKNTVGCPF